MRSLWTKLGVIFIIGLAIFAYSEGWGADWKYIGINAHGSIWEIDTTSISCQPNNIVRAWVKVTYSKEDVTDFWVKKFGEGCKDFSYSIELTESHCTEKKWRILSLTQYSLGRGVIISDDSPGKWIFIVPDSMGEAIFKVVCEQPK